jgi:hypothetical protein
MKQVDALATHDIRPQIGWGLAKNPALILSECPWRDRAYPKRLRGASMTALALFYIKTDL